MTWLTIRGKRADRETTEHTENTEKTKDKRKDRFRSMAARPCFLFCFCFFRVFRVFRGFPLTSQDFETIRPVFRSTWWAERASSGGPTVMLPDAGRNLSLVGHDLPVPARLMRATVAAAVRVATGHEALSTRVTRVVHRVATRLDVPGSACRDAGRTRRRCW
jgi:hypothetical protein